MKSLSSSEMSLLTIVRAKSAKHLYLEFLRDFVRGEHYYQLDYEYIISWLKEIFTKSKKDHILTETEFEGFFINLIVLCTDILKFQNHLEKGLLSKEFDLYSLYEAFLDKISNDLAFFDDYNIITSHICDLMKENKLFSNLLSTNTGYINKSNILYYFYLPFQYIIRLSKYFHIILLNTNRSSMLHSVILQLFDNSLYITKQIKGSIEQSGNRTMLITIEDRLKGKYPIVELHRIYLYEKSVKIINKEEVSRYLYLFSDLIIVCTQSSTSSNIQFEYAVKYVGCESIPQLPNNLVVYGIEQSFVIIFPSVESKCQWQEAISQSLTHSYSNETLHLDKISPAPSRSCSFCNQAFGLLKKKYHCNKCGLVVCQQCFIKKPDRICKDCNDNPNKAVNNRKQRLKDSLDSNDVTTVPRHLSRRASSYTTGLHTYCIPIKKNSVVEKNFIRRSLITSTYKRKEYKIHVIVKKKYNKKNYKNDCQIDQICLQELQKLQLDNLYNNTNISSSNSNSTDFLSPTNNKRHSNESYQSDRLSDLYEPRSRFSSVSTDRALTPLVVEWIENPLFNPSSNMKCKITYTYIKDKITNSSIVSNANNNNNNNPSMNGSISHMPSFKQQTQRQRSTTEYGSFNLSASLNQSFLRRSVTNTSQTLSQQQQQQQLLHMSMKLSTNNNNVPVPLPSSLSSSSPIINSSSNANTRLRSGSGCISPRLLSPTHSIKHINKNNNKNNPWDFLEGTLNPVISSPSHLPKSPPQHSPFPPPPFVKSNKNKIVIEASLNPPELNLSVSTSSGRSGNSRFRSKTIAIQPDEGKDIYDVGSSSESYKDSFLPNNQRYESKSVSFGSASLSTALNTGNMRHLPPTVQLAMASYKLNAADNLPDKQHKRSRNRARSSRKTFG